LWLILSTLIPLLAFTNCRRTGSEEAALLQTVTLNCEPLEELDGTARFAVYALLDESKVKLAEINSCDYISPDNYATLGIPEDALTAVGGMFEDTGEYLYAQLKAEQLQFFIASVGEEVPKFTPLAIYEKKKFQLLRPLHLADLAGYYMHQGVDTSYVLFLGLKGPDLVSKLFATGDPMPAQKVLQRALPQFASTPDLPLDCDLNTLSFSSKLGYGQFFWRPDSAALTFQHFMGEDKTIAFELMSY
jgi:hypothetical protein